MLVRCSNPDCTIEFADSLSACPVCQAPPEQAAASAAYEARRQDVVAAENGRVLLVSLFVLFLLLLPASLFVVCLFVASAGFAVF